MNTAKKYTKAEDAIIVKCVRKYPNNLQKAFQIASEQMEGRKPTVISTHWYTKLSKTAKCYLLSSDKATVANRKLTKTVENNRKYTKFQKLVKVLFNL